MTTVSLASLPALNACLNAASAFFLLLGYSFIRRGKMNPHRISMLAAFACSTVFLASYLYFHFHAGLIRFGGQGWIRPVYFAILISHTILAIVIVPMVLVTLSRALREKFDRHRAIARWTFPLWLYVSVTGVIVYWLLYIAYTPIGASVYRASPSCHFPLALVIFGRMTPDAQPRASFGGRWTYGVIALALLFVLMPFLFWNATWFGRPLTDDQLAKALGDRSHPRDIQHALAQIEMRMEAHDASVRRWYPEIVALSADPVDEIRVTDAWLMGQDNTSPAFHDALARLLADSQPMVQRNAALSLVRFQDDAGRAQILAMLRPCAMQAPLAGTLETRLKPGDVVNPGTLLAHIEATGDTSGKAREVRATVPGTLDRWLAVNHSAVSVGQPIVSLDPSESMVWEALRALYLIGRPEDLPDVERFARGVDGMSPQVAQQAQATSRAIRDRSHS